MKNAMHEKYWAENPKIIRLLASEVRCGRFVNPSWEIYVHIIIWTVDILEHQVFFHPLLDWKSWLETFQNEHINFYTTI